MAKIEHDKYYTPQHIVDLVIERTKEVIGLDNITEFIEPSAGKGAFLDALYKLGKPVQAYDLYPEREDIIEQDFLKLEKQYKKGVCVIGNPPFGKGNILSVQFYKKSIKLGDYVVFILPISQLNNNQQMYEFDLIHSEDLNINSYSGINLHCCLNFYKRNGEFNKKEKLEFKDLEIVELRNRSGILNKKINFEDYDISLCSRGNGTVGKILNGYGKYNMELHIKITNNKLKNKIINLIKITDWKYILKNISSKYISITTMYKYLKEQIPELE